METKNKEFMLASVLDKFDLANKKNKIQNTTFYNENEISKIKKELRNYKNYFFFGGYESAERKILITYPEKFDENIVMKNVDSILKAIKIKLPHELSRKI